MPATNKKPISNWHFDDIVWLSGSSDMAENIRGQKTIFQNNLSLRKLDEAAFGPV
jgi:hypothetical protein